MLVLTFQKKLIANKITNGNYYVDLYKSNFSHSSLRFTLGYNKILNELRRKGVPLEQDEGCIWGWVSSPSRELIKMYMMCGYVAMFIDIDPSKCVMSDYDKYSDYIHRESNDSDFILEQPRGNKHCVQCSFTMDAIYEVRGVFTQPTLVIYNSIIRSFYAIQTMEGMRYSYWLDGLKKAGYKKHTFKYKKERFLYQIRAVLNEPIFNSRNLLSYRSKILFKV